MTDSIARLRTAGVSVWLDDLSRERLTAGGLAALSRPGSIGGDDQPDDLRPRHHRQRRLRRQIRDLKLRQAGGPGAAGTDRVRRTAGLRRAAPGVRGDRRGGRAGVDRGRPADRPRHRPHGRRGPRAVVAGGPAQPVRQDPGRQAGPAGDHRLPGRGDQHQRHADLLPGPLRRGDRGVPGRTGSRPRRRARPVRPRLGRLVLRVPGGHRGGPAAGQDRHAQAAALRGKAAIANARLAYQRYEQSVATGRWKSLERAGARPQRPLWASTSVKDPAYDDTRYVPAWSPPA